MDENKLIRVINGSGGKTDKIDPNAKLKDYIADSLEFISFFIELEQEFDIEIPDTIYNEKLLEYTMEDVQRLILQCKGGE